MRYAALAVRIGLAISITILLFSYAHVSTAYRNVMKHGAEMIQKIEANSNGDQIFQHSREHIEKILDRIHGDNGTAKRKGAAHISGTAHSAGSTITQAGPGYSTRQWATSNATIKHFTLERDAPAEEPASSVLYLTITRDAQSWGHNPAEDPRTLLSHLDMVTNTTLSGDRSSLGLLTESEDEFKNYIKILTPSDKPANASDKSQFPFRRITIILHQSPTRATIPNEDSKQEDSGREARHNVPQHERRARLAKLRNYLQFTALHSESHIMWLDSDVYKFSSNLMVEAMINMTSTTDKHEVGVLTSRCRRGEPEKVDAWLAEHPEFTIPDEAKDKDSAKRRKEIKELRGEEGGRYEIIAHRTKAQGHYDLNAWAGRRTGPNNIQQEGLWKDIASWTPSGAGDQTHILDGLIRDTKDSDLTSLDSVGGTILMIRADWVRMGLIFPVGYFVGMSFEHGEGWDGIETEGLCLVTRSMSRDGGSGCFTLGGEWAVWHTVY